MKPRPGVDVVVVARNEERDITACLESLAQQSYLGAIQVYVVDHGSQDRTAALAAAGGATVVRAQGRLGAARNRGIEAGSQPLVAFLDAHCVASAGWLQALVGRLQECQAGGVQGGLDYRFSQPGAKQPRAAGPQAGSAYAWLKTGNCLYRRQALTAVQGFHEGLISCEDVDLSWRVLQQGYALAFCPQARVIHLDRGSWWHHWRRFFRHGLGAGQISRRFSLSIAARPRLGAPGPGWLYWLGSWWGRRRCHEPPLLTPAPLRRWQAWSERLALRPRVGVLWWYTEEGSAVLARQQRRCQMEGSGSLFWRCLSKGWTRSQLVERLSRASSTPAEAIARDLDEWLASLLEEEWLEVATIRPESRTPPD